MGNTCSNKNSTGVEAGKSGKDSTDDPKRKRSVLQQIGDKLAGRPPWNPSTNVDSPPRKKRELDEYPLYAPSAQKNGVDKNKINSKDKTGNPASPEDDSKKKTSPDDTKSGCCLEC